ncbi:hypothetical protein [Bacillus sp. FJAT-22090]|uniref:hypothetical protein n=1 Tax=Bacillus sp. FJAT-22090 TaxID=1581038 RepID=UPI0011A8CE43|nr:hypothetical protein [Bacillus sp. FJAT-22090]
MNELTKVAFNLSKELAKGQVTNYSNTDANEMIRGAFLEEIGTDAIDYNTYRQNKYKIFQILQETIAPIINDRLEEVMGRFAEVRNVGWGDSLVFDIENPELFEVSVIADGTGNLMKQRIDNGKMTVDLKTYGIAIYDEFYRFLAGRTDWGTLVAKVAKSYEKRIAESVNSAIYGSYNSIDAAFKYSGTFSEDELLRVLQNVEALYGNAMVVGTKAALAKIKPDYVGDADKARYNALGYIGTFRGYDTVALVQSFKPNTYEFNLSNTDLLILPSSSEKIVKIVTEGTAIIEDVQNMQGDMSIEHYFIQKAGVGLSITEKFGIVRFT